MAIGFDLDMVMSRLGALLPASHFLLRIVYSEASPGEADLRVVLVQTFGAVGEILRAALHSRLCSLLVFNAVFFHTFVTTRASH